MPLLIAALALQPAADPAAGRAVPPNAFVHAAPARAADHEAVVIFYESTGPDRELRRVLVRSGRWVREGSAAEAEGRPVSLTVNRLSPEQVRLNDRTGHTRLDPAKSERVIGETCFWSDNVSHGGVVITSGHRECLTGDGLPLRVTGHHRVWQANLTATALSRGRPPLAAMMPPREAFDRADGSGPPTDAARSRLSSPFSYMAAFCHPARMASESRLRMTGRHGSAHPRRQPDFFSSWEAETYETSGCLPASPRHGVKARERRR